MRAVTFSNDRVVKALEKGFVCTWFNQAKDLFPATPKGKGDRQPAVSEHYLKSFPDGGGGANVKIFFCTPDGLIVHQTEGHYRPASLLDEVRFAKGLLAKAGSHGKRTQALRIRFVAIHRQRARDLDGKALRQRRGEVPKDQEQALAWRQRLQFLLVRARNHEKAAERVLRDPRPFMINESLAIV